MKEFFKDLRDPKFWASVCAWMVPISIAVLWGVGINYCWTRSEIGTFIAAIAGPFAGLAGFLYIFVSFIQQQRQFNEQQSQFFVQHNQLVKQNFESVFFNLFKLYKSQQASSFPPNGRPSIARLKQFENLLKYQKEYLSQGSYRDEVIIERATALGIAFKDMDYQIRSIIQCLYAVCIHIDHHKDLIDERYYFEILRMQLEPAETNLVFYGFFSWIGEDFPKNEIILARFLNSMDSKNLLIPGDSGLLKEILIGEES